MPHNVSDPFEDEDDNALDEDQWYSDASNTDEGWGDEDAEAVPEVEAVDEDEEDEDEEMDAGIADDEE